nr:hypothetical protein [Tanacetum cinerariifolium]
MVDGLPNVVEKSVKDIIKDEIKSLLPQILHKEVSDFITPVIQSTNNESLKNAVLAKSSTQPKSTYEATASRTEFELKKILPNKIERRHAFNLLKGTCKSFVELDYYFKECYKAVTDQLNWNNPEGHEYPFDLSKPLSFSKAQGHQVIPADYFFKDDLEYLKGGSSSGKYTTSTTKTKAAKYDIIDDIKDMVLTLWSPVKVAYDKFSL